MTSFLPRAALSVCVLIAFAAGCASGKRTSRPEPDQPSNEGKMTQLDIDRSAGDPVKALQAKAPSLLISRSPDGDLAVQIRGVSSFSSGNEPLIVIDDVPITAGPGGALRGVNAYDIESIKVLKDPSETGIYGMRGANGVIVIKMKKPGKRGT
jgi:TonB-dependent SusC/RagA subfamily outer membrane receptor